MKWTLMILLSLNFSTADSPNSGCSVSAEERETAILPVNLNLTQGSSLSIPIIKWKTETGDIVHQYWYDHDDNKDQNERFKGRTSLFEEEITKGNLSLKIINVTKNDEGKYICQVHIEEDKSYTVSLCVTEISERRGPTESPEPEQSGLTRCQIVGTAIGVLIVLAALTGVTVFLYRRRKATKRRYDGAEVDKRVMETLRGGGEHVYSSEDQTSI